MQLWRCCSGGLSRVDTMEGRKKKSSYQLENFTRSLPTPVNRQKKLIFSVRLRLCELSSKMACRLYLAQVATGSSQNLSGATDVFLLTHRHRVSVDDGKESATFVVFDREMIKLIKKEAKSGSCVDTLVAVGGMELPKCPQELAGNGYLFSYVGNSNKAPVVDLKSGQPTVFASSTGDAAKIAVGNDGANQPGSAYCRQRQNPQTPT
ncbi:hypothetical protein HID58_091792 [Brassica napus]|uniref:Uncharacterized protein n=1 Tax=Brassica napus TaxID=3708 RepID=A0ABQ7WYJ3_BRANA|nr:hypothetical protein HID58_091792 [Brassica napus]